MHTIYHASSVRFDKFIDRPTWFSINKEDASKWHTYASNKQFTYVCKFEGRVATLDETRKIAATIWPDADLIYSMFDPKIGEFDDDEIEDFIAAMKNAGYDAAYNEDYDPSNYEGPTGTTSICVLSPSKSVAIIKMMDKFPS